MLTARVGPEPSSTRPGAGDDPRPRCVGLRPRPPRQLSRCLTGECGPPASTICAAAIRPSPSISSPRRAEPRFAPFQEIYLRRPRHRRGRSLAITQRQPRRCRSICQYHAARPHPRRRDHAGHKQPGPAARESFIGGCVDRNSCSGMQPRCEFCNRRRKSSATAFQSSTRSTRR